ncbi:hypothetical protein BH23GEM9_BH23GEM9_18760 [soil metagenome]
MLRRMLLLMILVWIPLSACSKRQPPAAVAAVPDTAGAGARRAAELERLRQDSIARARAAEEEARLRGGAEATARARAILEETVHFDYDDSTLRADAQEALGRKVPVLRANPNVRIRIAGHADERGSVEYNLALGMRRANAVRDYLSGFGIDAARFETTSMGEDMPLDPRGTEAAWALNRRAEFSIVAGGEMLLMPGS